VTPILFLLSLFAAAIGAGLLGAVLGLGGGMLLVPILTMFFGVSLHYAMGASIISVIATCSGAAAGYLQSGLSNIRIGLYLCLATVSGALVGATLVGVVPPRALELIFGLALAYSALTTFKQLRVDVPAEPEADSLALRFSLQGSYHDRALNRAVTYRATQVKRGTVAMFAAGLLSGLLGIGSGAFKVLAMDYFMKLPMKVSTATSNFMIGITAAASAGIFFGRGDIHPVIVTPVAVGVLVGAFIGTKLLTRLRNRTVRMLFLPVLLYLSVSMILRGLGVHLR
jgi:uncharacterized membrane protein YfcA